MFWLVKLLIPIKTSILDKIEPPARYSQGPYGVGAAEAGRGDNDRTKGCYRPASLILATLWCFPSAASSGHGGTVQQVHGHKKNFEVC